MTTSNCSEDSAEDPIVPGDPGELLNIFKVAVKMLGEIPDPKAEPDELAEVAIGCRIMLGLWLGEPEWLS